MAAEDITTRSFSIGNVFSRAFGVMGHNPLVAFGASFLLGALPYAVVTYLVFNLNVDLRQSSLFLGFATSIAIGIVFYLVLRSIVQGCLVRATIAESEGRQASFGECVTVAFNRLLPLIGASILFTLAIMVGFVLLIVPGIMIAVTYAVVVPVTVEEGIGVRAAFRRAAALTRGRRWKIFGLFALLIVVLWLLSAISGLLQMLLIGLPQPSATPFPFFSVPSIVFSAVITTISITLSATMLTSLYVELREWKDGPVVRRLSDIFE